MVRPHSLVNSATNVGRQSICYVRYNLLKGELAIGKAMFSLRPVLLIGLVFIIITCASCSPQLTRTVPPLIKPTSSPCCSPQSLRAITLPPNPIPSSFGPFPSLHPFPPPS